MKYLSTNPFNQKPGLTRALICSVAMGAAAFLQAGETTKPDTGVTLPDRFRAIAGDNIAGSTVVDTHNAKVGKIADFVVTFGELGRVTHIVIGSGLFPGIGDDLRLVPAEVVKPHKDRYRLTVPKQIVMMAEPLTGDYASDVNKKEVLDRIDALYEIQNEDNAARHYTYRNLEDDDVETPDGREIGFVDDLLISLRKEITPYLMVVPTDPILGQRGTRRFAIPTSQIKESTVDNPIEITTTTRFEELMSAPVPADMEHLSMKDNDRGRVLVFKD